MNENRISLSFTDAEKTQISQAIQTLNTLLSPKLIALPKEDKLRLAKISDDAIPFAEKVAQYTVSNPEFNPRFMTAEEFAKDLSAFTLLREFSRLLSQISSNIDDTRTLAGSEADEYARAYYAAVGQAAKMGVPGAQAIYDDLSVRFETQRTKRPKPLKPQV